MAKKSYLKSEDQSKAEKFFLNGDFWSQKNPELGSKEIFNWLEERLLKRLESLDQFANVRAVALGSWSRGELCLGSDIDLILLGDEAAIGAFAKDAAEQGLKVRYRTPLDKKDWTAGVQPFDVLALTQGKALHASDQAVVDEQKAKIFKDRARWSKEIAKAIKTERASRRERYDSMANYLQPNLKYGQGGLRDIDQVLSYLSFFKPEILKEWPQAVDHLAQVKHFIISLRQLSHLMGEGDLLSAQAQLQLTTILGFKDLKSFMKKTQVTLSDGSFFADGLMTLGQKPVKARKFDALPKVKNFSDLFEQLSKSEFTQVEPWLINFDLRSKNSSILKQGTFPQEFFLKILLKEDRGDIFWLNLYRSNLLDRFLPGYKDIKGLVQHDHYHRYTVDAHLIQALRGVSRAQKNPKTLAHLSVVAKTLSEEDWTILRYAALFHDLGKGRSEDHSQVGMRLVEEELTQCKLNPKWIKEIAWLVENHLILSTAAFRMNPADSKTWKRLFDRGVQGHRVNLLIVFTAVDIIATNPEAWTTWKSQTMLDLFKHLTSPAAGQFGKLMELGEKKSLPKGLLEKMDSFLVAQIKPEKLIPDLKKVLASKEDLAPLVLANAKGSSWVRFHRKVDRPGLFMEFVQRLYLLGDHIQACVVMTDPDVGVYDWFCLRGRKTKDQILKRLKASMKVEPDLNLPPVSFESIDLISDTPEEAIISFRGKNQKGLLLSAAQALHELNLSIVWVRAHTWGSQVDDSFAVKPNVSSGNEAMDQVIHRLKARFVT